MKIVFRACKGDSQFAVWDEWEYLDPQEYEHSENDPLSEREEARINRIVWGKKIYLPPVIIEGEFSKK